MRESKRKPQPKQTRKPRVERRRADTAAVWLTNWRAAALVGALALAARLAHLVDFARLPLFTQPTLDAGLYVEFAKRYAETGALPDVFFKPPLFPVLLGVWWNVVGENWFALRLPLILIGSGTAVLTWVVAKRVFGAHVALLAGLMYALHSSAVYFESELLEMGLVTFVHVGAFYLIVRAGRSPSRAWALVCGGALGLGIVARPTFLLFALLALLALQRRRVPWAAVGLLAALAPVTLHNTLRGGDFVLVSSNLGLNFYIGNNANANGRIASTPELPAEPARARVEARRIAEDNSGTALSPSAVSRFWLRRGIEHAATHPGQSANLALRKLFFLWSGTPLSDNEDMLSLRRYLRVYSFLPVGMWLLAPLGLVGLLFTRSRHASSAWNLWLARGYVVAGALAVWPFFVVERFRLPWTPVLAVFAAWTLVELVTRLRNAPRRALHLGTAAVLALIACNVPAFGVRDTLNVDLDYKVAYAYHQQGRIDDALRLYRDAVERNPRGALARNALGYLLAERGEDLDEAARLVREALVIEATSPRPEHTANFAESLAFVELRRQDPTAARAACDLGLTSGPDRRTRTLLLLRRAEANRALGNSTDARTDASTALDLAPTDDLRADALSLVESLSVDAQHE